MRKIAVGDLGEFWYGDYKEPFVQLDGAVPGYPQGVVLKDDDGRLLCAYCGKTFDNLGRHLSTHGLTAREYKTETGLLQKSALVSEKGRLQRIAAALRSGGHITKDNAASISASGQNASRSARRARGRSKVAEHLNKTGRCYAQVLAVARTIQQRHGRVTAKLMRSYGIHDGTVYMHFGSHAKLSLMVGDVHLRGTANRWSDDELLTALRSLAQELGRTPGASDLGRFGLPVSTTYSRRFGSYAQACVAAGIPPNLPQPMTHNLEVRVLVAYAISGDSHRVARSLGLRNDRVLDVLHRYGFPFSSGFRWNNAERREWAADMARRLTSTGVPEAA